MLFWILNPMVTASFEDLALRGQKSYFSYGAGFILFTLAFR